MKNSSKSAKFPLWLHSTGQWSKKIRGRYYYFGKNRDIALAEYLRVREDLEAGRTPPPADGEQITLRGVCNAFLTHKKHQVETGELTARTFANYYDTCELMLKHLGRNTLVDGIRPSDLMALRRKLAETRGAVALGNEITRTRTVFHFAFENELLEKPIRFGEFKRPKKSAVRRERAAKGPRMLESVELRKVLEMASPRLRAMIFLGVNCGFGNHDCATLPTGAIDLDGGWITYARPKTGVHRRCPLWAETVEAIREVLKARKAPRDEKHACLLFLTQYGGPWFHEDKSSTAITNEFRKLLKRAGLYRPGLSFYALRHTFQTVADELGDYVAVKKIMGHADGSMSDLYRERFSDSRLQRVTEHVQGWLFSDD